MSSTRWAQQGWQVVGVTTKKEFLIAPLQAIILIRELRAGLARVAKPAL